MYDDNSKFVFVFAVLFSGFVLADTLTWEQGTFFVTDNATFIAGTNFTFEEIWTQTSQIILNGSSISAFSNGLNPNITLMEFFANNATSFDIQAQNNSWVSVNLNSSVYEKPLNVTLNGSMISENVSWFYYPSNTTVTVNTTYNSSQRISLTFAALSVPPTTTTTTTATTTTTLASGGAGGGAAGGTAATTPKTTTTTLQATTTTTPQIPKETSGNDALKSEVEGLIGKVQEAITRAESLKVDIDRSKKLLAEAYKAYEQGDYVLAKAIAEQAFNETLKNVQEKAKEPSKIPMAYLIGVASGIILIFGLAYWKRDYLRERIRPVKPAIEEAVSKLKAVEVRKEEVVVKPIKLVQAKISSILDRPQSFEGKDVEILGCKIFPLKENGNGWWHRIDDGTGEIFGFSSKRIEGNGTVEGTVRIVNGKVFVEF